jgi:hypothetical protein
MGITGSRCLSLHVLLALMILLCIAGFATRPAINIGVHSLPLTQPASCASRTASRSGPVSEMVIFAAPQALIMIEEPDIQFLILLVAETIIYIFQNWGANGMLLFITQNALQAIK